MTPLIHTTINYAFRVAAQLHQEGKLEASQFLLNSFLEAHPHQPYVLHLLGLIAYQTGQPNAVFLIERAIESAPTIGLFQSNLGEIHRQLKNLELSLQYGKRAVELDPLSATAWSNLGVTYFDLGQYPEAENCHQRALALNPSLSSSLNNLGSLYKAYGKTQKAIAFYEAAITASPHDVEPLNNLGRLFLQQQEFIPAERCFHHVLQLAPTLARGHCNRGLALLELNRGQEALLHFEQALLYQPDYDEAYYGRARIFLRRHNFLAAERDIQKALLLSPHQLEFYQVLADLEQAQGRALEALKQVDRGLSLGSSLNLSLKKGSLLMEMGEITSAEKQFKAIAEDPAVETRILAHYSLVQLRKVEFDHPSLKALLDIEKTPSGLSDVPPTKRPYLYFALGKCHNDLGEWSKAFEYFSQGCALKRRQMTYDIQEQIQFADRLIHGFTQKTLEGLRSFATLSELPIFIVGMPRSGSTLVEQILANCQGVHGAGELTYLSDLIHQPVSSLHSSSPTILNYPENLTEFSLENCQTITNQYLSYLRRFSPEAIRITDKMPNNFIAIGLIHALFPRAKIIHVKRHPLDTCLSCYTKLFSEGQCYSYDLAELGQYYGCYDRIMTHWRNLLPPTAFLEVHYEHLTQDLETEAKRLLTYCDLPWDPACLSFYQAKREVRTASFMQVRQPIYPSSVNSWRRFETQLKPLIETLSALGVSL